MENKDISKLIESERNINLKLIEQDKREREQFGDKNYLDVALEASKKFNSEFDGTFDGSREHNMELNYNQNNLDGIKKILKKIIK